MTAGSNLAALCCLVPLAAGGCFSSTGPMTIEGVNAATGQKLCEVPLVVFYWASKHSGHGGHLTKTLIERCDVQFYTGKSPLTIRPPRHLGFAPFILEGTCWACLVRVIAPGYELAFSPDQVDESDRRIYRLVPLDEKEIALDSIYWIAFLADELYTFVAAEGTDRTAKHRFYQSVIDLYTCWQKRWGDSTVRYRAHGLQPPGGPLFPYYHSEGLVRVAEALVQKLRQCLAQERKPRSTTRH